MRLPSSLPLPHTSVLVVLGSGAVAVLGMAVLGVLQFSDAPGSAPSVVNVRQAVMAFLVSLSLLSAFFLLVAVGAAWISGRAVSGDVEFVTRRVRAITDRGDLGEPVAIRTLDEVGELTRAFEGLRAAYKEQLERDRDARRRAQDADLMKTEFLTTVSHELRTPLNSILGFTQVLLSEIEGPLLPGQREDLQMIQASGEHLLELFNNVLDLSALVSGRIDLQLAEVSLEEVIDQAVQLLEAQAKGRPVSVLVDVHGPLPPVRADRTRVMQILMNLGGNAIKFTESGEVRISAETHANELVVRIHDTGVGIDPHELQYIFDPYAQTGGIERREQGSGLGLSICKRLVTLHRGRLWADSQLGVGSTFCFSLPLARKDP